MAKKAPKKKRQKELVEKLRKNPFLTDEELAAIFKVSVPTIRLDRLELNIAEYRQRIKDMAKDSVDKLKGIKASDIMGELVYIHPGKEAISVLETSRQMLFADSRVVRGHYIYSMAETLAIAVSDTDAALIGVANIKYKKPILAGVRLTARAEVRKIEDEKITVWVKIRQDDTEVFQGKFVLLSVRS